jgi:hypothetical protein
MTSAGALFAEPAVYIIARGCTGYDERVRSVEAPSRRRLSFVRARFPHSLIQINAAIDRSGMMEAQGCRCLVHDRRSS